MRLKHMIIAAICVLGLLAPAASAQVADDVIAVELLPGWRENTDTHIAALKFSLKPGWKTYWRVPGEGGIPPQFDWSGSENIGAVQIHWPTPKVFEINGLQSYGYGGEFILPITLNMKDGTDPLTLKAAVSMGVCETVCVPVNLRLEARMSGAKDARDTRIVTALADRPRPAEGAGIGPARCRFEPISDGLKVTATVPMANPGKDAVAVFELPDPTIWVSASSTRHEDGIMTSSAEMVPPDAKPFSLSRSDIRITVLADSGAYDIHGCTG